MKKPLLFLLATIASTSATSARAGEPWTCEVRCTYLAKHDKPNKPYYPGDQLLVYREQNMERIYTHYSVGSALTRNTALQNAFASCQPIQDGPDHELLKEHTGVVDCTNKQE